MSRQASDILVLGGGLVGLAFAVALARATPARPWRIAVVERHPPAAPGPETGLRVSAISPASAALLAGCGAWPPDPDRSGVCRRMSVWRDGGPAASDSIHFDAAELGEPALAYIVENEVLRWNLWQQAAAAGIELLAAVPVSLQESSAGVDLHCDDGSVLATRLLVGADGAVSWVRDALGVPARRHGYGQRAIVTHLAGDRPHNDTAWQRFAPGGPVALLPLADGRVSLVWSCAAEEAGARLADSPAALGQALTGLTQAVLGPLTVTAPVRSFPLAALHATAYQRGRGVLIGDAAHQVHPLAGQGVNLGLRDAAELAGLLAGHAAVAGADPGDRRVLRRYERGRKGDNLATLAAMDLLHAAFSGSHPALAALAGTGLGLADRLPPLKRLLAGRALGHAPRPAAGGPAA